MTNPTSNFGWQMPTPTDLVTDLPADFEVFGQAVDTSMADLKGGTTGQILSKATNADMDFTWITNDVGDITAVNAGTGISGGGTSGAVTITNSMATAITTAGDLIKGTGSGTFDRLGIGSSGQVLTVAAGVPSWQTASSGAPIVAGKNKVINGSFLVNQRVYASAANLASGAYGFDRWKSNFTNTTLTFTAAPQGQSLTINSGGGLQQVIERANMPAATYTLSFTGTATARVYNFGATPPSYAASPITVTLDGSADVVVEFTASGGTRTVGEVQLETGSSSSSFSLSSGSIQGELAACQRYFYRASNATGFEATLQGFYQTASEMNVSITFPVTMRIKPTFVSTGSFYSYINGGADYVNSMTLAASSPMAAIIKNTTESSGGAGGSFAFGLVDSTSSLSFSSEL